MAWSLEIGTIETVEVESGRVVGACGTAGGVEVSVNTEANMGGALLAVGGATESGVGGVIDKASAKATMGATAKTGAATASTRAEAEVGTGR